MPPVMTKTPSKDEPAVFVLVDPERPSRGWVKTRLPSTLSDDVMQYDLDDPTVPLPYRYFLAAALYQSVERNRNK